MNRKSGFTLAEVLITLMIIGVIAAMTIPSLLQNTAQQEFRAAYKKAVSMVNQAVTLNYALDGEDATVFKENSFMHLLTKRMNVMSSDAIGNAGGYIYTADGMKFEVVTSIPGGQTIGDCRSEGASSTIPCAAIMVDVNGSKGPNKTTETTDQVYDRFYIAVYPQKALPGNATLSQLLYLK